MQTIDTASPIDAPPAPATDVPGPRAAAFKTLYNSALQSTLKAISYESFAACFPQITLQAPQALQAMWKGMRDGLEGFAIREFEMILEEREVIPRLNALEAIIAEAQRRKDSDGGSIEYAPPHSLPPRELITAHLTPLYTSQQGQLNAKLQTVQSLNASLMADIHAQQKEIAALLELAEKLVHDTASAAEVASKMQQLGEEAGDAATILEKFETKSLD
ncbi:hypothetical protein K3495_g3442 [Podosphaera aphanis]|nr:hypothetical protein K3495_g3442 [Podosphaera aphanis]